MGLKRAMDRIKRKIRRKKGLLLASILVLFFCMGMLVGKVDASGDISFVNLDNNNFCPSCNEVAHVGLDDHDYLTLYDGRPERGEIVRRLFQLDIESIESTLPEGTVEQLRHGIRVLDDIEFSSVLSSYNDYAMEAQVDQ